MHIINDEFDKYNEDEKHLISEYVKDHVEKRFLTELNNSRLENLRREYFLLINEKEGSLLRERMKYCKELEDEKRHNYKNFNSR